jgi:hypothetical protein
VNEREFWDRVDALLDERRDPLDDEAVQRHLAGDSRAMDEYVRMTRALHRLPRPRRSRRAIAVLVVGAAAFVALVGYVRLVAEAPPQPVVAHSEQASTVLDFKITVVRESSTSRSSTTIENDHRTDSRERIAVATPGLATLITTYHRESTP